LRTNTLKSWKLNELINQVKLVYLKFWTFFLPFLFSEFVLISICLNFIFPTLAERLADTFKKTSERERERQREKERERDTFKKRGAAACLCFNILQFAAIAVSQRGT